MGFKKVWKYELIKYVEIVMFLIFCERFKFFFLVLFIVLELYKKLCFFILNILLYNLYIYYKLW